MLSYVFTCFPYLSHFHSFPTKAWILDWQLETLGGCKSKWLKIVFWQVSRWGVLHGLATKPLSLLPWDLTTVSDWSIPRICDGMEMHEAWFIIFHHDSEWFVRTVLLCLASQLQETHVPSCWLTVTKCYVLTGEVVNTHIWNSPSVGHVTIYVKVMLVYFAKLTKGRKWPWGSASVHCLHCVPPHRLPSECTPGLVAEESFPLF